MWHGRAGTRARYLEVDVDQLRQTATEDGQFGGRLAGVRVDVFVPAIASYASLNSRKRLVRLLDRPIHILCPEDLLTLKMIFFRRKDVADAEAMLRGNETIDLRQVRNTLVCLTFFSIAPNMGGNEAYCNRNAENLLEDAS